MISKRLSAIILTALLTSASVFSQSWQPKIIEYKAESGLFVPFPIMDSISLKLIERNELKGENKRVWSLYFKSQREAAASEAKFFAAQSSAESWENLYKNSEAQKVLLKDNFETQKTLTKKARKKGLVLFGGGLVLGGLVALIAI